MLVPVDEWRRLQAAARPSLKQLLLSDQGRAVLVVPARGAARRRTPLAQGECMYLLGTNVVSELCNAKPHGAVLAWFEGLDDTQLHLSALTISEVQAGIELTRKQDAFKASALEA